MNPIIKNPQQIAAKRKRVFFWSIGIVVALMVLSANSPNKSPSSSSTAAAGGQISSNALSGDLKHFLALMIIGTGQLCASVDDVRPLGNQIYRVTCTRWRDGSGIATYEIDMMTGAVK